MVAHEALLNGLQCTRLALTEPCMPCIPDILRTINMQTVVIPTLTQLIEAEATDDVTVPKPFADAKNDPLFILHTSGSTGKPP